MKKETIQILVGVGTIALLGVGAVILINKNGKKILPESILDKLSEENKKQVFELHPNARLKFAQFISAIQDKGYIVVITSGHRDFNKQAQLYLENPNNAKAGYSNHNYGYAIDINIIDPKTGKTILRKASSDEEWKKSGIVDIAKKMGFEWGGDFKNYQDPIHFAIPREKTTAQMYALVKEGKVDKDGYVLAFSGFSGAIENQLELSNKPDDLAA